MNLDHLSAEEWQALDDELDRLLDLDPSDREEELAAIATADSERAQVLQALLESEQTQQRIDDSLLAALSFLADREPKAENTRIGAWRLLRRIGEGGMAEVYLAERADGAFEQTAALKLLWPGLKGEATDRLVRQERQILAAMDDVRIARLFDGGVSDDDRPWLAMEYVQGRTITHHCDREKLDLMDRIRLFVPVVRAVALAHRQLVVHGDLKPAHLLVNDSGQIKLLDFGIGQLLDHQARISQDDPRWHALTPEYASPEQRSGQTPSPASDIYQLGLLLRELTEDVAGSDRLIYRELTAIINRACQPDPARRYLGADRLADDLNALLQRRPVNAYSRSAAYRFGALLRRQWPAWSLAGVLLLLASAAGLHQYDQAQRLAEGHATNEAVLTYLEQLLISANPYLNQSAERLSREALKEAAARLDQDLRDQPQAQARVLNVLGELHRARTELVMARERHERALFLANQHDLPEARDRARSGLATIGIWDGDYAQSEALMRQLLAERKEHHGPNSELVTLGELILADLVHSRGDYDTSVTLVEAARQRDWYGNWSERLQGMLLRDQGFLTAADETLRGVIESERAMGLERDAYHSATLDHRAITLMHMGDWDQATRLLDQSDVVRRGLRESDWDGLLWTRNWRALAALGQGELEQAEALIERMVSDYERFFSESSHLLAFARSDRAWIALAQGEPTAALTDFDQAIARIEAIQRFDHPRLAEMLMGRAMALLALGRTDAARTSAERAYDIRSRLLAPTATQDWLGNSCRVLQWSGGHCDLPEPTYEFEFGLDRQRVERAVAGLCSRTTQARSPSPLCFQTTL
ncbi:MAG: protein kinase, partial [Pseudomonadota bacterium]